MLAAVSSWGLHPALRYSQSEAGSSRHPSPSPPVHTRPIAEQDAIEALLSIGGSSVFPGKTAAPECPQSTSTTPPDQADTEAITVRSSKHNYIESTGEQGLVEPSSVAGPSTIKSRNSKSKAKATASSIAKKRANRRSKKEINEDEDGEEAECRALREYYIEESKWIGKDKETGEDIHEKPGHKSPAPPYQVHILTWIFDNVTPYPEVFWKALLAIKLAYNYHKINHWFTNQRQRIARQRREAGEPAPDELEVIYLHGRKQKMRGCALESTERWTDGRFIDTIDMLIADRKRQFEEELARHRAMYGDNPAPHTSDDDATTDESSDDGGTE
ncbi:hypothetical protein DAEQUDRAFT_467445 [Daedalea quercina L-15889]|uniref:Homeobox domain-containing protein n=1 Tax=Daedalea quercina L-15889 TaxID=1314783 RepID=A0A165TG30_9APHY|nr:hypothetical protein DAEQUDRAFT_467445 [Daedalea quercina L-15889]